jgi:hypothetical protein
MLVLKNQRNVGLLFLLHLPPPPLQTYPLQVRRQQHHTSIPPGQNQLSLFHIAQLAKKRSDLDLAKLVGTPWTPGNKGQIYFVVSMKCYRHVK